MKYAGLKYNDIVDGVGICVSLWTQGCPFKCKGCHNPETWDIRGGYEVPKDLKFQIIKAIQANGIMRNFSILGGEPFATWNQEFVLDIVTAVRAAFPNIKIYIWSGYYYEDLINKNEIVDSILDKCDYLIDGPFEIEKKDLKLKLRGSTNQHIVPLHLDK